MRDAPAFSMVLISSSRTLSGPPSGGRLPRSAGRRPVLLLAAARFLAGALFFGPRGRRLARVPRRCRGRLALACRDTLGALGLALAPLVDALAGPAPCAPAGARRRRLLRPA